MSWILSIQRIRQLERGVDSRHSAYVQQKQSHKQKQKNEQKQEQVQQRKQEEKHKQEQEKTISRNKTTSEGIPGKTQQHAAEVCSSHDWQ